MKSVQHNLTGLSHYRRLSETPSRGCFQPSNLVTKSYCDSLYLFNDPYERIFQEFVDYSGELFPFCIKFYFLNMNPIK